MFANNFRHIKCSRNSVKCDERRVMLANFVGDAVRKSGCKEGRKWINTKKQGIKENNKNGNRE